MRPAVGDLHRRGEPDHRRGRGPQAPAPAVRPGRCHSRRPPGARRPAVVTGPTHVDRSARPEGSPDDAGRRPTAELPFDARGRSAPGGGDVRARRRHVVDERLDLGRGQGPRHDGQRRPVGDRPRGPRVGRVHPHQQQGRRPDRAPAGLHPGPPRVRHRRAGDGPRPGPAGGHRLLGDPRRPGRLAPAAVHAVAHPRQLRGGRAEAGLRPRRRRRGHRRRHRALARRVHHDVPVVAGRLRAGDRRHRASCCWASARSGTSRSPATDTSTSSGRDCPWSGWAASS